MHGNIRQAYGHNPLMVLLSPYVLTGFVLQYSPLRKTQADFHRRFYGKTASLLVFGMIIVYWIGRNL
ncbi:hypothetical protein GCM10028803_16500 [Larkinella knui]